MQIRKIVPDPIYAFTPWQVIETAETRHHFARNATLFALANGTLGVRGAPGNGEGETSGTFLNGFYESAPIHYPETAYGFAHTSQTMVNVVDATPLFILVNGQEVAALNISHHQRTLDMQAGTLTTEETLSLAEGDINLKITRLVSLSQRHIFAQEIVVTSSSLDGTVTVRSGVNADTRLKKAGSDPRTGSHLQGRIFEIRRHTLDATTVVFEQHTRSSGMALACCVTHVCSAGITPSVNEGEFTQHFDYELRLKPGESIVLHKYASYISTQHTSADRLESDAASLAQAAAAEGFAALCAQQRAVLDAFWATADVVIEGDDALQQGIRFNLFHLFQSVGRDGRTNIAAKGLTGEGYEGHYFWDTEMYVVPFFLYTAPQLARALLSYRYSVLDNARQRARELGHARGASFAWRTINGDECSAYFPAGSAQYHINADIAYAVQRYVEVTGDQAFMDTMGVEILAETARLWAELGAFIEGKGFCICGVTGPDEYTALVDNNTYTNLMAQANLRWAVAALRSLKARQPADYESLVLKIGLREDEIQRFEQAADAMYLPYDSQRDLFGQDDTFLQKPVWDFANTPPEQYPLLLHFHPMVIYRHQVCKQADLVLALYLLGDQFTPEQKRRHFDYYEAVTTHDSSLSACIHGIVASEIGDHEKAYDYFMATARMDIDDTHHNVKDGVHIANMAGTWMCVVSGFGGLRVREGRLRLRPTLPRQWQGYSFCLKVRDAVLRVQVRPSGVTYTLEAGQSLAFDHGDQPVTLQAGASLSLPLVTS
jgi:alpha,alpha-trehalose phosphorylase